MEVILIGLVIFLLYKNHKYKKKYEQLLKKIKELEENQDNKTPLIEKESLTQEINWHQQQINLNTKNGVIDTKENKEMKVEETIKNTKTATKNNYKLKDDEGIKNKFILMTGAILIVLAAIVFLTSTWNTVPNLLKTSVIILLTGVFLGASNIAKKVFKLEETANTFLYIALAYLPISLFSISLFGLIGEYFSIYGNGNNLYFAVSTGILAYLYFIIGNSRKQNVLIHSSMIMQLLFTIFISLCISNKINIVILSIIIYNTILLLIKKKYFKEYLTILNIYNNIYLYSMVAIELFLLTDYNLVVDIICNALLIFNLYLNYMQNKNYLNIIMILTQILIFVVSCLNICSNIFSFQVGQIIFYIVLIGMYVIGIQNKKVEWKESTMLVVETVMMLLLYLLTITGSKIDLIIKRYIIAWTLSILNIVNYNISNRKKLFINIIPIFIFFSQIYTIIENKLSINYLIYLEMGIFAFSILNLLKDKKSNIILQNYSNVMMISAVIIGFIINFNKMYANTILFILLIILYGIGYIRNKNFKIYKLSSYFILNFVLYSILYRFNILKYDKYILFLTTIIITLIELYIENQRDLSSKVYIIVSYIISYIILNTYINIASFISIIILDIIFIIYIRNKNINENTGIIPFAALLPSVYISKWEIIDNMNLMIFASFILIFITTMLSIRKERINIYTFISTTYILMQTFSLKLNIYINLIIYILWAIVHLIKMPADKTKFEIIIYILGLVLYNNILKDISKISNIIASITAFKYLGYMIFVICITRNILKKYYLKGYKIIEYIVFSILCIFEIFSYTTQIDGMILVFMFVCIIVYSFIKKFGPIFFTSTVAVILNVFFLTKKFWFSVPWWIYMLAIGSILIIFAIKNELNENRNKGLIKNKMKSFKEYIDM